MANFLTTSETDIASQMTARQIAAQEAERKALAYGALAKVYGPSAGDPAAADQLAQTRQRQGDYDRMQAYQMLGVLDGVAQTHPGDTAALGAAFDSLAPALPAMGVNAAHIPQFRQLLLSQPEATLAKLRQSFAPSQQMGVTGAVTPIQNADGTYGLVAHDKMGNVIPLALPQGAQPSAPVQGAERVATGQQNAATAAAGLPIRQQQADTATYNAGVRAENQQYGAPEGTALPAQGGAALPPPTPPRAFSVQTATGIVKDLVPGAVISSATRTPEHNAAVGGVPNSEHIDGTALDIVPPKGVSTAMLADHFRQAGIPGKFIDEGDHVHWQWGRPRDTNSALPEATAPATPTPQPPAASPVAGGLPANLTGKGRATAIATAQRLVQNGALLQNTDQLITSAMQQIGPASAGLASIADLPGSSVRNLRANLASLKALGLNQWLASLKNQAGQTGIGRVLQSEVANAQALYGNLEQDQSPAQLLYHLKLFQQSVHKLQQIQEQGFRTQYGVSSDAAIGTTAQAPAPAPAAQQSPAVDYRHYFGGGQ